MEIRVIDKGELIFDIKFGQKRKGWIKVKFVSVPGSQNSCPECVMRRVCYDSPICSEIITFINGYLPPNFQHYRIVKLNHKFNDES